MSDLLPDGADRGRAGLLAARLADFRYARLAVRGRLTGRGAGAVRRRSRPASAGEAREAAPVGR
ncbi:hypothetical protein [Streptomyces sp. CC53]|uniref:hypothetical protein n=1 Tax=unclassified Streptomyces TaxID=2593676 RepID=UPI00352889B6